MGDSLDEQGVKMGSCADQAPLVGNCAIIDKRNVADVGGAAGGFANDHVGGAHVPIMLGRRRQAGVKRAGRHQAHTVSDGIAGFDDHLRPERQVQRDDLGCQR